MMVVLRRCCLYAPAYAGIRDILVAGERVAAVVDALPALQLPGLVEIDCRGKVVVPGFIDSHVHILGGGGSTGPHTRGPELSLTEFTRWGITTVVGLLGADGLTRDLMGLLAKARALDMEGVTTYVFIGAYDVPPPTLTGSLKKDLFLVDKALGAGEIAIADVRSSQPTLQEIIRIAADAAVAGRLTGRGGVVNIHMGPGKAGMQLLMDAVEQSDLPAATFLPTHCNRSSRVLDDAVRWGRLGGPVDLTTHRVIPGGIWCPEALDHLLGKGVTLDRISMSTDAGGVYPHLEGGAMARWETHLLHDEFKSLVQGGVGLETAVRLVTENPARHLRLLRRKGRIAPGCDADLVVLNDDLGIDKVLARGRLMVDGGRPLVSGTFE